VKKEITLEVFSEAQAEELHAAWLEIVSGKAPRLTTAATDLNEIMDRAMVALPIILKSIQDHRGTGQRGRLVRFIAGLYNGDDYHFDLTDLRVLDTELANACIDYLNYDRLCKAEVHKHVPGGGHQLEKWFDDVRLVPRPKLDERTDQAHRLWALSKRRGPNPNELLRAAVEDLLSTYEGRTFKGLRAPQPSSDDDRPMSHACFADAAPITPLCGAADGPWSATGFRFRELTCVDCIDELLKDAKRA
jgi:hypothetical protein